MDTDVKDKQDEYRCQGWTGWIQTSGVDRLGRIQTSGVNRLGRIQTSGMNRMYPDVGVDRVDGIQMSRWTGWVEYRHQGWTD